MHIIGRVADHTVSDRVIRPEESELNQSQKNQRYCNRSNHYYHQQHAKKLSKTKKSSHRQGEVSL